MKREVNLIWANKKWEFTPIFVANIHFVCFSKQNLRSSNNYGEMKPKLIDMNAHIELFTTSDWHECILIDMNVHQLLSFATLIQVNELNDCIQRTEFVVQFIQI